MTIGQRIKDRRIQLGLTVDELATILKKNRATVYRYESNEIEKLPISILEPLSKALHTTPAYLMGWEDAEIKTEEDEKNAKVIIFEGGSMFDLDKLPDGTREDLTKIVQILPYETSDNDFKLQVIIDKEEILNLDALPLDKKKDLMKYIRFLLSDEK